MTTVKKITQNMQNKEYLINEINDSLSIAAKFGQKNTENAGLYFYFYGGSYADMSGNAIEIQDGSILCLANKTNYVEYNPTTKTVVLAPNNDPFTVGYIPLAKVTTDASKIVNNGIIDCRILPLLPTGSNPLLGGGGSSTSGFADLKVVDSSIATLSFTVKGGKYWQNARRVNNASEQNIGDYASTSNFSSIDANSIYYVVYNMTTNQFQTYKNSSYPGFTANALLLYVITTDSSKYTVQDYRAFNILINSKVLMKSTSLVSGAYAYTFNMSEYYYLNQVANDTVLAAINGQYPRFLRPYTCLLCLTDEKGYTAGEETEYLTSDIAGLIYGKPLTTKNNGNVEVYQGANMKIWNSTTGSWETPTTANWAIVIKLELEYH